MSVHRRLWSGVGRNRRSALSAVAAAVVTLTSLSACSNEPSTTVDPNATTTPVDSTTESDSIEDALYYYPPVEGATLTYESSGGLGAVTTDVTVDSVTSGSDGQTVVVTEVITATGGEPVTVERTLHTGADGSLRLSASAFAAFGPGFSVTAEGADILLRPIAELESGEESSGETFVEVVGAGVTIRNDVAYTVTGAGRESVTVPAGTVEAYVVEIQLDITSSVAGATTGSGRYWFVPGFGVVRQEFSVLTLATTTELVSSSVPLP